MKEYRFSLVPYEGPQSREECPSCGHESEFSRYIDNYTGELLPPHVGRCNREFQCGYHYTPKQYFEETGIKPTEAGYKSSTINRLEKPIDFLPDDDGFYHSVDNNQNNHLFSYFTNLFDNSVATEVFNKYMVGTSNHRWKEATMFWQIDISENLRQCKIILYDKETGKRVKEGYVERFNWKLNRFKTERTKNDCVLVYGKYLNGTTDSLNLQQCFFGEHLLSEHPDKTVAIVESEKTAMIASVYLKKYNWIATGGTHGCKWKDYAINKVLEGRNIILFPDASVAKGSDRRTAFEKWKERARSIREQIKCKIYISELLEKGATKEEKQNGWDIADYLVNEYNQ